MDISDGIGGDVNMVDTSSGGLGFYNADFTFDGTINGSVIMWDNTTTSSGGRVAWILQILNLVILLEIVNLLKIQYEDIRFILHI